MREIRSAGGVVWRDGPDGPEIAIIHRDRYDDWSLPKGKLDPGEHILAAAIREVREETGVVAVPTVRLPSVRYLTGVPDTEKVVDFWSMRTLSESPFTALDEVTEVRWASPTAADGLLTYAHDRGIVARFSALKPVTGILVLVRHAHAGSRSAWQGADDQRPLDTEGEREAAALGALLALFRPTRVFSAPLVRCVATVSAIGLPVRTDPLFAATTAAKPKAIATRLRALVADHGRVVVSSQGEVIPGVIKAFQPGNGSAGATYATAKGAAWVLSFADGEVVAADPLTLNSKRS